MAANEYKKIDAGYILWKIFTYAFLIIFSLFMILPFYFMIVTSFLPNDVYILGVNLFPMFSQLSFENYMLVFQVGQHNSQGFIVYFVNTFIVAIVSTSVTVITTLLAAFAFARLNFRGKNFLFMLILATMMIPGEMMVITNFKTADSFGWMNTFSSLILVHGVAVFYIFYLRQTFQQIPNELYLASKVDGYSDVQYFKKIMVPLASPTVVTIIILSVMGAWNSFIWPTLVASDVNSILYQFGINWSMKLVSNGLMAMFTGPDFAGNVPARLAGSMVTTIPLLIIFCCFRKKIMTGVSRSGIKG